MEQHQAMIELCRALVELRDGTTVRNRFGKIVPEPETSERFRLLGRAVEIPTGGSDIIDQAAMIAERILRSPDGFMPATKTEPAREGDWETRDVHGMNVIALAETGKMAHGYIFNRSHQPGAEVTDEDRARARRAVASVNAVAGIAVEDLENPRARALFAWTVQIGKGRGDL